MIIEKIRKKAAPVALALTFGSTVLTGCRGVGQPAYSEVAPVNPVVPTPEGPVILGPDGSRIDVVLTPPAPDSSTFTDDRGNTYQRYEIGGTQFFADASISTAYANGEQVNLFFVYRHKRPEAIFTTSGRQVCLFYSTRSSGCRWFSGSICSIRCDSEQWNPNSNCRSN